MILLETHATHISLKTVNTLEAEMKEELLRGNTDTGIVLSPTVPDPVSNGVLLFTWQTPQKNIFIPAVIAYDDNQNN